MGKNEILLRILLTLLLSPQLYTAVINVPSDQTSIDAALAEALNNDTILIASGIYNGDGFQNLQLNYERNIYISSENGAEECIVDLTDAFFLTAGNDTLGSWGMVRW